MEKFEERLRTCVRQEGRHLSDIIFRNWIIYVSNQNCIYYRLFSVNIIFFVLKIKKLQLFEEKKCVLFAPLYSTARQATDDGVIRRMPCAYWIMVATDTQSEYVIFIVFSRQQWLHEHPSIFGWYVHHLACVVLTCNWRVSNRSSYDLHPDFLENWSVIWVIIEGLLSRSLIH